jgi:hypothetical protein
MEAWRVWMRRHKIVCPKYHRVLQAHIDPSFLLTEGRKQARNLPREEKGMQEYTCSRQEREQAHRGNVTWIPFIRKRVCEDL